MKRDPSRKGETITASGRLSGQPPDCGHRRVAGPTPASNNGGQLRQPLQASNRPAVTIQPAERRNEDTNNNSNGKTLHSGSGYNICKSYSKILRQYLPESLNYKLRRSATSEVTSGAVRCASPGCCGCGRRCSCSCESSQDAASSLSGVSVASCTSCEASGSGQTAGRAAITSDVADGLRCATLSAESRALARAEAKVGSRKSLKLLRLAAEAGSFGDRPTPTSLTSARRPPSTAKSDGSAEPDGSIESNGIRHSDDSCEHPSELDAQCASGHWERRAALRNSCVSKASLANRLVSRLKLVHSSGRNRTTCGRAAAATIASAACHERNELVDQPQKQPQQGQQVQHLLLPCTTGETEATLVNTEAELCSWSPPSDGRSQECDLNGNFSPRRQDCKQSQLQASRRQTPSIRPVQPPPKSCGFIKRKTFMYLKRQDTEAEGKEASDSSLLKDCYDSRTNSRLENPSSQVHSQTVDQNIKNSPNGLSRRLSNKNASDELKVYLIEEEDEEEKEEEEEEEEEEEHDEDDEKEDQYKLPGHFARLELPTRKFAPRRIHQSNSNTKTKAKMLTSKADSPGFHGFGMVQRAAAYTTDASLKIVALVLGLGLLALASGSMVSSAQQMPFRSQPAQNQHHNQHLQHSQPSHHQLQQQQPPLHLPPPQQLQQPPQSSPPQHNSGARLTPQPAAGSLVANINCNKIRGHVTLTPNLQGTTTVSTQINAGPPGEVYQWAIHQFPVKPGAATCSCSQLVLGSKLVDLSEMHGNLPSDQEFTVQSALQLFGFDSPVGHSLLLRGMKTGMTACATFLPTSRKSTYRAKFHSPLSGSVTIFQTAFGSSFTSHLMYSNGTRRHSLHRFDLLKSDDNVITTSLGPNSALPLIGSRSVETAHQLALEQREHENELSACRRVSNGEQPLLKNLTYQLSVSTENFGMRGRSSMVLPLIPFETFASVYVVVYSEHDPSEPIACAPLKFVRPKTAAAKFQSVSVQGSVMFSQDSPYDVTIARVNMNMPNNDGHSYGIDELPMIIRRKSDTRVCPNIRETIYNPHHIEPSSVPPEGEATSDQYAVGDLSGKYGSLTGKSTEKIQVNDFNLPLFGPASIIGRALTVYSADGVAIACSNVELTAPMTTAFATFDFGIQGQFIFRQPLNDCNSDTYVYIEVSKPVGAGGTSSTSGSTSSTGSEQHSRSIDHNWHIHVHPVDSGLDHLSTTDCNQAGGHFNPYNTSTSSIYSRDCTPFNALRCELGDMSSKMFTIEIPPYRVKGGQEPDIGKFFGTDIDLPLCGPVSVVNRSVTVHSQDFGMQRLACSTIIEFKPRSSSQKA